MKNLLFQLVILLVFISSCKKDTVVNKSDSADILAFSLPEGQVGDAVINGDSSKITVWIEKGTDISSVSPAVTVSDGASVLPAPGVKIDFASKDNRYNYKVISSSGNTRTWYVEFKEYQAPGADYEVYTISNVAGGKLMEVGGDLLLNEKYANGQKIQQGQSSLSGSSVVRWQKWHLIYKTTADTVRYYELRNLHSGKYLEVSESSASGDQLQQNSETQDLSDRQLWKLEKVGNNGQYRIINKANGLAISDQNGSTSDGAKIIGETPADNDRQKWIFNRVPVDSYRDDAVVGFFNRNLSSQGSVAFDEGMSIPLYYSTNKGKVLWITQDAWDGSSLLANGKFDCNAFFSYNNSVLIQPSITNWNPDNTPNITIPNSNTGRPKQVFDNQPGTSWSWPGPGVEVDDHVYVQCGEGKDLTATNQSLYILTENTGSYQWAATRLTPAGMSGQADINYSAGMVKASDGYIYSFGSKSLSFGYASNIYVARFPYNSPHLWKFWNGSAWADSPVSSDAAKIADGLGSSAVAYVNGKYVLMTMDQGFNCETDRNIYIATGSSPTGPFSQRKLVYTIHEYFAGGYARYYTPAIHPEFVNGHNELLVTYCLNFSGCGLSSCQNGYMDPYYYRVKGVRIPYSMIGL